MFEEVTNLFHGIFYEVLRKKIMILDNVCVCEFLIRFYQSYLLFICKEGQRRRIEPLFLIHQYMILRFHKTPCYLVVSMLIHKALLLVTSTNIAVKISVNGDITNNHCDKNV